MVCSIASSSSSSLISNHRRRGVSVVGLCWRPVAITNHSTPNHDTFVPVLSSPFCLTD